MFHMSRMRSYARSVTKLAYVSLMYNIIMIKIKLSYLNMYQNEKFQRRTAILSTSVQDCTLVNVMYGPNITSTS